MKRRYVLGVVGAAGASVAGCIGDEDSPDAECETEVIGGDDGTVIQQATVAPRDGGGVLEVVFGDESAAASGASRLSVFQEDDLLHYIPVGDRRTYRVTVGTVPVHGVYRIVASDSERTELDTMVIEFNCFTDE
ncbi:hypothetical protein [Natronocalculus amylovorans]|uniref:Lipoprotein n=1 Tax=Natronocalculus amylovorans TaxID=2917812 RepID=A0AAE3FV31_9EURY|nr:hypothetical protein [Natronocalculus amylovorans]MCL9816107.1 hypothetical protein [Natronocalculus amylovorans]